MYDVINQYLLDISESFFDPRKRIFVGYLFCALLVALLWLTCFKKERLFSAVKTIFAKKVWWSRSARADYQIFFINKFLLLLISPLLLTQLAIASTLFFFLHDVFPERSLLRTEWSAFSLGLLFTLTYFIADDFARFYVHRLMHRWPLLWAFHKVHHTATSLTPMTVLRTHPVEAILFSLRSVLVQGVLISMFVFFFGDRVDLLTIAGANIFSFVFNVIGANFRHSHIAIHYWKPLEKILISPAQHHIHHSMDEKHWDKNYGVVFAVWDLWFGSHHYSEKESELSFGIKDECDHGLVSLYLKPCIDCYVVIKTFFIGIHRSIKIIPRAILAIGNSSCITQSTLQDVGCFEKHSSNDQL